jgi:hypothetical protein
MTKVQINFDIFICAIYDVNHGSAIKLLIPIPTSLVLNSRSKGGGA